MLHPYRTIARVSALVILLAGAARADRGRTNFLSYGPSAAATGMGGADTALASDAGVLYYNPALLLRIPDQVTASHWFLFDGARYDFVGLAVNNDGSAFGFGGAQLYRGNIIARQTLTDAGEKTSNSQMAAFGAWAGRLAALKLDYGLALKWLRYSMYTYDASGFGADAGLRKTLYARAYPLGRKLSVSAGLSAANIWQTGVRMDTENEKLPLTLKAGIGVTATLRPRYDRAADRFTYDGLSAEADVSRSDGGTALSAGAQYALLGRYFLRAGYDNGPAFGVGTKFGDISFDYAFTAKDLANFHRVGFSYAFGDPPVEDNGGTIPVTDDFQRVYRQALRLYDRLTRAGEDMIRQGLLEDAQKSLLTAIPLNPGDNSKAKGLLQACEKALLSGKGDILTSQANEILSRDAGAAYDYYMEAYRLTGDRLILSGADGILQKNPALTARRSAFISDRLRDFSVQLDSMDFTGVGGEIALLAPLAGEKDLARLRDELNSRENAYIAGLKATADAYEGKGKAAEAYKYLSAAYALCEDGTVMERMTRIRSRYRAGRKYSVQDGIYADKLYYMMAADLAGGGDYASARSELLRFDPFYDIGEFTDSLVRLGRQAPERLPVGKEEK